MINLLKEPNLKIVDTKYVFPEENAPFTAGENPT